jgi:hypothetical protein
MLGEVRDRVGLLVTVAVTESQTPLLSTSNPLSHVEWYMYNCT